MSKERQSCLIAGRFITLNCPDRVEIFDMKQPRANEAGDRVPLGVFPVKAPQSQHNACLLALGWLRDNQHLSTLEYFREAEQILVSSAAEPQRYNEKPVNDCLE